MQKLVVGNEVEGEVAAGGLTFASKQASEARILKSQDSNGGEIENSGNSPLTVTSEHRATPHDYTPVSFLSFFFMSFFRRNTNFFFCYYLSQVIQRLWPTSARFRRGEVLSTILIRPSICVLLFRPLVYKLSIYMTGSSHSQGLDDKRGLGELWNCGTAGHVGQHGIG